MLREISEEVRINLKDRLREMRHAIRRHRHDTGDASVLPPPPGGRTPFPLPEIDGLVSRAVSVFDDAMTMAETLVPHDGRGHSKPMPFDTYFRPAGSLLDGERAFRRDMYYLAKSMLARRNAVAEPVQEAGFAAVHAAMLRQHGHLFQPLKPDAGETERTARAAALCAALLVELLRARPVRPRLPEGRIANVLEAETVLAVSVLAPMALAVALASSDADAENSSDLLDIAALAVEARLDRIMPACRAADPAAELTPIFAMLIFHLR
jgi:hypothetical protein